MSALPGPKAGKAGTPCMLLGAWNLTLLHTRPPLVLLTILIFSRSHRSILVLVGLFTISSEVDKLDDTR